MRQWYEWDSGLWILGMQYPPDRQNNSNVKNSRQFVEVDVGQFRCLIILCSPIFRSLKQTRQTTYHVKNSGGVMTGMRIGEDEIRSPDLGPEAELLPWYLHLFLISAPTL